MAMPPRSSPVMVTCSIALQPVWPSEVIRKVPPKLAQAPAAQAWPVAHARPHIPQLAGSKAVLVQVVPQSVVPGPHEITHAPAVQTWPAAQARPQVPQLARSTIVLVQ